MTTSPAAEALNAYGPVSPPHAFDRKTARTVFGDIFHSSRRSSMARAEEKRFSEANTLATRSSHDGVDSGRSSTSRPAPVESRTESRTKAKPTKAKKNKVDVPILIMPPMRFYN